MMNEIENEYLATCAYCGKTVHENEINMVDYDLDICTVCEAKGEMNKEFKEMVCVDNSTYEDCLTLGKTYEVYQDPHGMYHLHDDDNEALQTMIDRFEEVKES